MALKILWTPRAKKGFDKILEYLLNEFSETEARALIQQTFKVLDNLSEYPELLKLSPSKKIRRGPINKYTLITYRIKPRTKELQILNIRGSRQNP